MGLLDVVAGQFDPGFLKTIRMAVGNLEYVAK